MCLISVLQEDIWTLLLLVLSLLIVYGYRPHDVSKMLQSIGETIEPIISGHETPGKRFQLEIMDDCCLTPGDPPVYLLNLKPESGCQVFGPPTQNPSNKTIMLVGAVGSGKTTLINGMINYMLGVDWEDNWRFKLIDEQTKAAQGCSLTSEVTAYQIHHREEFQVPYSLTILDTPGFGGSGGNVKDREIAERIRDFFTVQDGINEIDAVCFVVQASLASLTPTQKYIFEAILSIFGKDIGNNILTLVTFADGQSPPILKAITAANISCAKNADKSPIHFEFNNSALFTRHAGGNGAEENNDHMFWNMGKESMQRFFTHLMKVQPQSLMLTREVIQERLQLEETVEGLQPVIQNFLLVLEEIKTTRAGLQNLEAQKKDDEEFEYEVEYDKHVRVPIPPETSILNCPKCSFTCHYPCDLPKEADKRECNAFDNGMCTVCPGKCVWTVHYNAPSRWETTRVKEKRTFTELKNKYEAALKQQRMSMENIILQLEVEYAQVQGRVIDKLITVTKCLKRLSEIALRPVPLTTPDYIDLLIQAEKREAKAGHTQRINELQGVKQSAVIVQKMANGEKITAKENEIWEKMKSNVKGLFNDFCL